MDGTDSMDRLEENASDPTEDGAASADERYHVGFVLEQTLGHRTHAQNLRRFVAQAPDIAAAFLPIAFEPEGPLARLLIARGNWSVRASWLAQRVVRRSPHSGRSGHVGRPAASGAAVTPAITPPDGRRRQTGGRRP